MSVCLKCDFLLLDRVGNVHKSRLNTNTVRRGEAQKLKLKGLKPSYMHYRALSHRAAGCCLRGLCVLFQSSKLLGLGFPLSLYHSATLMVTRTLKFYSRLQNGVGGGAKETHVSLALLCTAGGHFAILLLHKRLLQVPM